MNDDITNFPLSWPLNQARTKPSERRRAAFQTRKGSVYTWGPMRRHTIYEGAHELEAEIKRMAGHDIIISSNLKVKANGLPYSGQKRPDDPGVAVYFKWHKRDLVFACDKWTEPEDNLWAIVKHIEALRGQERWGVGSLDQAFAGYAALPAPSENWWEILGIPKLANDDEIDQAYRSLAQVYHPDKPTGNTEMFIRIGNAYKLAKGKNK